MSINGHPGQKEVGVYRYMCDRERREKRIRNRVMTPRFLILILLENSQFETLITLVSDHRQHRTTGYASWYHRLMLYWGLVHAQVCIP